MGGIPIHWQNGVREETISEERRPTIDCAEQSGQATDDTGGLGGILLVDETQRNQAHGLL